MGKLGYRAATASRSAERRRCNHSGVRRPGWRRGNNRRSGGVLTKPTGEQRRRAQFADHQFLDFVRAGKQHLQPGRIVGGGNAENHSVVRPHHVDFVTRLGPQVARPPRSPKGRGPGRQRATRSPRASRRSRPRTIRPPRCDPRRLARGCHLILAGTASGSALPDHPTHAAT